MKRLLLYVSIAVAMLGCTKVDEIESSSTDDGAIIFSSEEITRVTDGGSTLSWEIGEEVQIVSSDGSKWALYTITDTSSGLMSYSSGEKFYTDTYNPQTFYGWSPSTLSPNADNKFALDLSDQKEIKQFVYGSAATSNNTVTSLTNAKFSFDPIYTKIVFNIEAGGLDIINLSGATATISGVNLKGYYDPATGEFSDLTSATISPEVVVDADGSSATITLYILETESMSGDLYIIINGELFSIDLSDKNWVKGSVYEYNVAVGESSDIVFEKNIYKIYSAKGMKAFADLVNGDVNSSDAKISGDGFASFGTSNSTISGKLMRDIDLSSICSESSGVSWTPIGSYISSASDNISYSGEFDGNRYEISGLYINNDTDQKGQALFGYISTGCSIAGLGVSGSVSSTSSYATAGIVAVASGGNVTSCYNSATIKGASNTGGILGVSSAFLSNSYNTGSISGNDDVGGLVGSTEGSIYYCYNTGSVNGDTSVGGIVGHNYKSVSCNYNRGSVSGVSSVGGLVGENAYSVNGCYSTGSVSGSSSTGGVVGKSYNQDGSYTYNTVCYWLETAYVGEGVGGYIDLSTVSINNIESKSASYMQSAEFVTLFAYYGSIWQTDYETPINDGYPILSWQ